MRLTTLVESLLVLGACWAERAAGIGHEDVSATALRLFPTGARPAQSQ